jgi:hypothetical protein
MSKFSAMKQQRAAKPVNENQTPAVVSVADTVKAVASRTPGREGKKMVGAYYPPEVSRALKMLAAEQGTDLQTILGEAIDDLMRKHGKHSLGLTGRRS